MKIGGRTVLFAYFKNDGGLWRNVVVHADDGMMVNIPGNTLVGGTKVEVDKMKGTATGATIHDKATGLYYAAYYDEASQAWVPSVVVGP